MTVSAGKGKISFMKVLMVNKFLYPNGGSETYIFRLGEQLQKQGVEVQYFGMGDKRNIVGNRAGSYTSNMDFHSGKISKFLYPFKIIYSLEARRAIRKVLDDFQPNAVHLNNFNYQLTPSILYEIRKYERKQGKPVKILFTAHDYQLICPNHLMRCPRTEKNCSECNGGKYRNCIRGRCIHNSALKSILGAAEGWLYRFLKTYRKIDVIICPSAFMQKQMEQHPDLRGKTVMMRNFTTVSGAGREKLPEKENYAIYFGRYSKEKGMETLLKVCRELPDISFVFAGTGPYEEQIKKIKNIRDMGMLQKEELRPVVEKARFSIYPSEWYENCPFSVMESIQYGTPVIGADIGGIPELIRDGVTGTIFQSGCVTELKDKIREFWSNEDKAMEYSRNCSKTNFTSVEEYALLMKQYYTN